MKIMKAGGALLVLGILLAAFAPAGALAAEPALYECAKQTKVEKKYHGRFTEKKCATEATEAQQAEGKKNAYELREGIGKGKGFKGKGGGTNLEVKGLGGVTCTASSDAGAFTGPKTAGKVSVVFKGCALLGHSCENASKAGEIKTNTLKGEIGYINKETHEVGVDLSPETGLYEATFHCGEIEMRVSGSVIGVVKSPLNVFTKVATLDFEQAAGRQDVEGFEGEPNDTLGTEIAKLGTESFGEAFGSGEEAEVTNKGEELELKA